MAVRYQAFNSCQMSPFLLVPQRKTTLLKCGSMRRAPHSQGFWKSAAGMPFLPIESDSMVVKMIQLIKEPETLSLALPTALCVTLACLMSSRVLTSLKRISRNLKFWETRVTMVLEKCNNSISANSENVTGRMFWLVMRQPRLPTFGLLLITQSPKYQ